MILRFILCHPTAKIVFLLIVAQMWSASLNAEDHNMKRDQQLFARVLAAALAGDKQKLLTFAQSDELDSLDGQGLSAVLHSLRAGRLDAIQLLIDAGADIDAHDPELSKNVIDQTAFLYAGATGNHAALTMLLAANPRTDIYNFYGGTALIPAAEKGYVETVRLLLEKTKIEVNHVNKLGWTALMEAVVLSDGGPDHQRIIELLLEHGANPNIADNEGITALQHATSKGFDDIVRLLKPGSQ